MQFDFFDKKIREAADRHHPSYDEQAWKRMRKLLDRHMPEEEENRRRFLFLIPLFLLLGGGICDSPPMSCTRNSISFSQGFTCS